MNVKLKTLLKVITFTFSLLPVLIVGIVTSTSIFGFANSMITEEVGVLSDAQASGVQNIVEAASDNVIALSSSDVVLSAVTDFTSVSGDVAALIDNCKTNGVNVLDVVITDASGAVIADGSGSAQGTVFFGYNDDVAAGAKTTAYVSDTYVNSDKYGGASFFIVSKAIRSNDTTTGYINQVVSSEAISSYLANTTLLSNGSVIIADKNAVINFNGAALTRFDDVSNGELKNKLSEILSSSIEGSSRQNFSAGGYVGGYGTVEGTGWIWAGVYNAGAITNSVLLVFIVAILILAAIGILGVAIMSVMSKKVTAPLAEMVVTIKEIKEGNKEQRLNTNLHNEFAQMAGTFNDMIDEAMISEELHRTISDISDNILFEWDFAKEIMYVSDNFKTKFDIDTSTASLMNGKFIDSLMSEEHAEQYKRDMNLLLKNKDNVGGEYEIKIKSGGTMWFSFRAHCITDRLGEILRVIGVITDIDSEKKMTLQLNERASYDFLSQLYNRNTFEREFQAELDRHQNSKIAALFIDVDDFKFINDRYSHAVGDEVIRYVADTIKAKVEGTGFAGRFGGDEFVLCVSDPKMLENLEVLSMDIIDELYSGYYSKSVDATLNIKASIGIAVSPDHGTDSHTLIGAADAAMYFVKKNGKANYHIYDPEDSATLDIEYTL